MGFASQGQSQALSQRLTSLPARLFLNIFLSILPLMQKRWAERKRSLPPEIAWVQERYSEVQAVDGSTMEMVYGSLYFFTQAHQRGQVDDVVTYLAANTKLLGIVKRKSKSAHPSPLELIPILTDAKPP